MTRLLDILFSITGVLILSPILLFLFIAGFFDTGSPLFMQERVGMSKKPFKLIKFRSMEVNTQNIATHLVQINSITKWGLFLRRSKLDELPQLFNVIMGDMSFVGPRPNLLNQFELIEYRERYNVYSVRPGITGLSQINKIDMSTPELLSSTDSIMIAEYNLFRYFKYIILTIFGKGYGDRVRF